VSIILNIDTAVQASSACLAKNGQPFLEKINPTPKDSAAWLHTAIKALLYETSTSFQELDAVAITEGPGSYTGLRVGMAAAKGLCYALHKPLLTINTLKMMAVAAQNHSPSLLCPMIDARRMEVFTAVFDQELNLLLPPANLILDETSFFDLLEEKSILFFGNGSTKFQPIMRHPNAEFADIEPTSRHMTGLSFQQFLNGDFANLAYSQPFYGKDFHSSIK
jgi:tRNA threonylcarbamoyladenosine biosynthesis protein TsaB